MKKVPDWLDSPPGAWGLLHAYLAGLSLPFGRPHFKIEYTAFQAFCLENTLPLNKSIECREWLYRAIKHNVIDFVNSGSSEHASVLPEMSDKVLQECWAQAQVEEQLVQDEDAVLTELRKIRELLEGKR